MDDTNVEVTETEPKIAVLKNKKTDLEIELSEEEDKDTKPLMRQELVALQQELDERVKRLPLPSTVQVVNFNELADMIAKKVWERKVVQKSGSKLSSKEYLIFNPGEADITVYHRIWGKHEKFSVVSDALMAYTSKIIKIEQSKSNITEISDVQPCSRELIVELKTELVNNPQVTMDFSEFGTMYTLQLPTADLTLEIVSGKCDASIYFRCVRIGIWEDKNICENINQIEHQAQVLAEVCAAAEEYKKQVCSEPEIICGMLTNGKEWILFTRKFDNGQVKWLKTQCFAASSIDKDSSQHKAVVLLHFKFFDSVKILCDAIARSFSEAILRKRSNDIPGDVIKESEDMESDSDTNNQSNNSDIGGGGGDGNNNTKNKNKNKKSEKVASVNEHETKKASLEKYTPLTAQNLRKHEFISILSSHGH